MKWYKLGGALVIIVGVFSTWIIISQRSDREISAEIVVTSREHNAREIFSHTIKTDCWVSIGGSIYDLTLYFVKNNDDILAGQVCGKIEPSVKLPSNLNINNLSSYRIGILAPS